MRSRCPMYDWDQSLAIKKQAASCSFLPKVLRPAHFFSDFPYHWQKEKLLYARIYTSLLGSSIKKLLVEVLSMNARVRKGVQVKRRETCKLKGRRLLFRSLSGFTSLNMDHVDMRRGAPHLDSPVLPRVTQQWGEPVWGCRAGCTSCALTEHRLDADIHTQKQRWDLQCSTSVIWLK